VSHCSFVWLAAWLHKISLLSVRAR